VNVQEFIRTIGASEPPPVLLFCAAKAPKAREATFEPFLAEQAARRVVETYVDPSVKDLAYTAYYADEARPSEIVLEAQTVPFLAERRVVLVHGAERFNTDSGAGPLLSYLEAPCAMTVLMLIASHVDKRTKFYRTCEKTGLIVECPAFHEREAAQWVRETAAARGRSMDLAACRELVQRTGVHLSDVNNALTVVMNYVGEAGVIREDDVVTACADVAEEEIWALTDAIASSNMGAALTALRKLLDMGRQEDEIIGTINWLLKSAYTVAQSGPQAPAISAFVAKKVQPLADKLGLTKLRDAFLLCTDTHFLIRSTGVDGALALELLVLKLAAPIRRAQAAPV
jgi:DNA polymerase-3 subunit delta